MAWCPQCQIPVSPLGLHRRGILHRKRKLLRALLADDRLTFQEISRRMGVSHERIRQVAQMLGAKAGHARRKEATRARRRLPAHIKRIVRRAHEAGLEASPIYTKYGRAMSRMVSIEGRPVAVSHLWRHRRLAAYVIRVRLWNGPRFVVFYADDLPQMLVVPAADVRPTAVVMGRERKNGIPESRMLRYVDAWHLLRRRKPWRTKGKEEQFLHAIASPNRLRERNTAAGAHER